MRDRFQVSKPNFLAVWAAVSLVAMIMFKIGVAQKWDVAVVGTLVPFWYIATIFRERWSFMSLWASFSFWLVIHLLIITFVFNVLLGHVSRVGMLLWVPIIMIEIVPLYALVDVLERKLRHAGREGM